MTEDPSTVGADGTYARTDPYTGRDPYAEADPYATDPYGEPATNRAPGGPTEKAEDAARRVVLAGIGAVASACDSAEQTFDRLVDRGERVRQDLRSRGDELRAEQAGTRGRVREYFRTAMDAFLDGVNIPNKADVDTINVKLNILTRKIDDLQMDTVRAATPGPTGTSDLTVRGAVPATDPEDLAT